MSDVDGDDSEIETVPEPVEKLLRSVTPPYVGRPDIEMDLFGWCYFLILAIILVPFLPFVVLAWLFSKLFEFAAEVRGE
ncbi:MAG: hypothetical protein ABEI99_08865 [Halobaculum sp.]